MKFDIYEAVTKRIIEQLEKGNIPWQKPWKVSGFYVDGKIDAKNLAFNRITKSPYSLLNQMLLEKRGEYASFKQWSDLGGKIKKGAEAEIVVFWKWLEYKEEGVNVQGETETGIKKIPYLRYLQVFHIDDVEGVEPLKIEKFEEANEFESVEEAEEIMSNYLSREQIKLTFGGDRAYYSPMLDCIHLPNKGAFNGNVSDFYSTAFHEIVHSTGAKHRLDRLSKNAFFGNEEYSQEELVAEIGASGMLNILNLETSASFKNNSAYIQSWIRALKNDKKLIVFASSKAEKAINYIFNGDEDEA